MAFTSGTIAGGTAATNHTDLLSKIRTFCTTGLGASNWSEIKWAMNGSEREWMFIAPGLSGTEQIFGGIRTVTGAGYANLQIAGHFGNRNASAPWDTVFDDQVLTALRYVTCAALPIDYWIVANGQRAVCVFRIGSVWSAFYIGFFLPYCTPNQYPYPFYLGGSNDSASAQMSDVVSHRLFIAPAQNTCATFLPINVWSDTRVYNTADAFSIGTTYIPLTVSTEIGASNAYAGATRANLDGSFNLFPVEIETTQAPGGRLGQLDGVYWCSGLDTSGSMIAAGTIADIGGTDHILFHAPGRTTFSEWCAVRLS